MSTTPCPPPDPSLSDLIKKREHLLHLMTSGVVEVEQPALGRTQFRTLAEIAEALRVVNGMIAVLCPVADPNAALRRRRPIYPVVTEI